MPSVPVTSQVILPPRELARRLPRLFGGLVLGGIGISLMVNADLGLGPWDVLHQGVNIHTGIPIGAANILIGALLMVLWIPLRERPGIGTFANMIMIGLTIDVVRIWLPEPSVMWQQLVFLGLGTFLFGPGTGLYLSAGLGPGPRDGLMTAIARRGPSVRRVRTLIELSALVFGFLLGGSVGLGTILFAFTIGPNVQFFLERFTR